eukprot:Skav220022  [mRNA]  locus=scaffold2981:9028:16296:+ [translate_table: standard]
MSKTETAAGDYRPEADVERLARYFAQRYGGDDSLLEARKALDPEVSFDLPAFEQALRKWGVKVDNAVELFAHIDVDFSGSISVEDLADFQVLQLMSLCAGLFLDAACAQSVDDGASPLYIASHQGHLEVVRLLVEAGADKNQATKSRGFSPLLIACHKGHTEVARLLIEAGADKNQTTKDGGLSPFMIASQRGHLEVAHLLIEAGADRTGPEDNIIEVEIANFLEQKAGGIVEAFENLKEILPGAVPKDFVRRLQEEYRTASEMKQRQEEDAERHEKDRKRRLAESLRIDSRHRAAKD